MTLYLIGLGLGSKKDISVKGLETLQKCHLIYLENYTSLFPCSLKELEKFYKKKVIPVNRQEVEEKGKEIIKEALTKEVAFLVIGDVFSATTHITLFKLAKEEGLNVKVINNASILNAVGITGLNLSKFGQTTSLPFFEKFAFLESPYQILKENKRRGLHTLFLLDLEPSQKKFMTIREGLKILEKIEKKKKEKIINPTTLVVGCARLGFDNFLIKKGTFSDLKSFDFGAPPHCFIIPGKLHFMEEEVLKDYQ